MEQRTLNEVVVVRFDRLELIKEKHSIGPLLIEANRRFELNVLRLWE